MSKIVFLLAPKTVYDGEFQTIGEHQLRLVFNSDIPSNDVLLSGFNLINEHNGFIQTVREDYKYIYRTYEDEPNKVELCNDGIEWVAPPDPPELDQIPEPDFNIKDIEYVPPLSNYELTECVADLMYEVSCLQLGL